MCGIVGAAAERDVTPILLEGLQRLEYRGYDSAGLAVVNAQNAIERVRAVGKVHQLRTALDANPTAGRVGIAHTRWATHGAPSDRNAHPHLCRDAHAIVHNGIIENFEQLRKEQRELGYEFSSDTDTEVVIHQFDRHLSSGADLLEAVRLTVRDLEGAYALGILSSTDPGRIVAARSGSPLVIGVGIGEHFIASDVFALLPVTQQFIFLEEGDIADIRRESVTVYNADGHRVHREVRRTELSADAADRGSYRHFMLK